MGINEEIYRIKSLLTENTEPFKIKVMSDIDTERGFCVYYLTENNSVIGIVTLTDLNKLLKNNEFQEDVHSLHENYTEKDKTVYLHSLTVSEEFRRKGYGKKLVKECENVARNSGYKKITAIVKKNNIPSQEMFISEGYEIYQSDNIRHLFIKNI